MVLGIKSKKLIAVDVKIGEVSEPKVAAKHIELLKEKGIKLKKFCGDAVYDINEIFNAIGDAESAIKIRTLQLIVIKEGEEGKRLGST